MKNVRWMPTFALLFSLTAVLGCASIYYKDVKGPDSARVLVKLENFPSPFMGNKPRIYEINGRHVAMGGDTGEFFLVPGDYTFTIKHHKKSGLQMLTFSDVSVRIEKAAEYTLTIKFIDDSKIIPDLVQIDK